MKESSISLYTAVIATPSLSPQYNFHIASDSGSIHQQLTKALSFIYCLNIFDTVLRNPGLFLNWISSFSHIGLVIEPSCLSLKTSARAKCNFLSLSRAINLMTGRIESPVAKSRAKKKLTTMYNDEISGTNYQAKSSKIESVFDAFGWA